MSARVGCLAVLVLAACRPVALVPKPEPAPVVPGIEFAAGWRDPDGLRRPVGGVACQVFRSEASEPECRGVTATAVEPALRFESLPPGPYRLVVLARDGLERSKQVDLPPHRRLRVEVTLEGELRSDAVTRSTASARRAVYVFAGDPGDDPAAETQRVQVLDPATLTLSVQLLGGN